MNKYNNKDIEKKWQDIWITKKCFEANIDNSKEKYLITIPFPYLNGNLHAGHVRTFTIGDVIARYKRMMGFNVLFPMAFHVTGTPIVGLAEQIKKRNSLVLNVYTKYHNINEDVLLSLNTPEKIVDYFKTEAENDMKSIGYSIDWRHKFTTTSLEFKKFVEWQYNILFEKGVLVKGSHPVKWCPNDNNPVEDHDILSGENATIIEYIIIKFRFKDIIFPCVTLRPETIYGVTNLWVNVNIDYYKVTLQEDEIIETWIVSSQCLEKLKYTNFKIIDINKINIIDYIGINIKNPCNDYSVPILPCTFIDSNVGTGVVMSVPAHSPNDYLAINDLKEIINNNKLLKIEYNKLNKNLINNIIPIEVINYKKNELYIKDIISHFNLKKQNDINIKDATKTIYKKEYNDGYLLPITGKYQNNKVCDIKDQIIEDFISQGIAVKYYELSEDVICRCGSSCLVNIVKDQWFLNYSNKYWKEKVKECLSKMTIIPNDLKNEFFNKIDWIKDKACARKKGLGTKLPVDKNWIIESLGDSTIYMAYYIISIFVNKKKISINQLTKNFFDYVFLNKGNPDIISLEINIDKSLLLDIKKNFDYWYPVDLRSSGKDLIPNHLLFYLFHHVIIFDKKYWPLSIAVNGFVSLEGKKMSKSKGPLLTLKSMINNYGADVTRFYILSNSEQTQDLNWKKDEIESVKKQIEKMYNFILNEINKNNIFNNNQSIYIWLESRLQKYINEAKISLEKLKTRNAIQNIYYLLKNDIKWYYQRGGTNSLKDIFNIWLKLLYPFIPHICEELWLKIGNTSYLYNEQYPIVNNDKINIDIELIENFIFDITKDIEEIIKITSLKKINSIFIITSQKWKYDILSIIEENIQSSNDNLLLKEIMKNENIKQNGNNVKKYYIKIMNYLKSLEYNQKISYIKCIKNEVDLLKKEIKYFEKIFDCNVYIINSINMNNYFDKDEKENILLKLQRSEPGKPAIYII